jgi:aliphatic sulfonates family ABC transporter substrate-binding protein
MRFSFAKTSLLVAAALLAVAGDASAKIRIAWQTGDVQTILQYADGAGLFRAAGLDYTLHAFPAGPAILPALAAKEVDIGWFGEFPTVTGYANGIPLAVFLIDQSFAEHVRLVASPDSGIKSLPDLKGKKIGVTFGSTSHHHILVALSQAGLKAEDVTLVNLQPAQIPAAYTAKQIDAAFTWEPNIAKLEDQGGVRIATTASLKNSTYGVWAGRTEFLKDNKDDVQKFLAVWDQAVAKLAAAPDEVLQYEAKRLGKSPEEINALVARQKIQRPSFKAQLTPACLGEPGKAGNGEFAKHASKIGDFLLSLERIKALPSDWSGLIDQQPLIDYLKAHP